MQNLKDISFDMGLMREYPSEWSTTGVAIPIMSKVKVVPGIGNVNGQIFMKDELVTAAWDVAYRLEIDTSSKLDKLKINEMQDLFACWFLVSFPKIRPGLIKEKMAFGYRETFNGVGVYVFKESEEYKIVAMENYGNESITLSMLGKNFKSGTNGCVVRDKGLFDKEFVIRMRLETGMLRVTYGPKMRQTSHKTCFEGLYLPNLSNKGFVGLTARNTKKYINDFSLNSVKVLNLDPRFYTER